MNTVRFHKTAYLWAVTSLEISWINNHAQNNYVGRLRFCFWDHVHVQNGEVYLLSVSWLSIHIVLHTHTHTHINRWYWPFVGSVNKYFSSPRPFFSLHGSLAIMVYWSCREDNTTNFLILQFSDFPNELQIISS